MNNEDILRMAKEAGWHMAGSGGDKSRLLITYELDDMVTLIKFAALVQAATAEECAQLLLNGVFLHDQAPPKLFANEAAKAIRTKFQDQATSSGEDR